MALPPTPLPIPPEAQAGVIQYLRSATDLYTTSYNIRQQLMMRDRAYFREEDQTEEQIRAKMANETGDSKKIQNVTVPVVMPQTESALANFTAIFLTGYPIFGTVAPPADQPSLAQFDAVIADNAVRFGWAGNLIKCMRNGLKYDLGAVEVVWKKLKIFNIETKQLQNQTRGEPVEVLYEGNSIINLDPYNLILDTRVSPDKNHLEGEYAGYTELLSRIATKKRMEDLDKTATMNFREAFECGTGSYSTDSTANAYFVPSINPDALLPTQNRLDHDWMKWASLPSGNNRPVNSIAYHNSYEWTVLYARIIPSDFGIKVANASNVQIWKFIIINRQVVIYAERQTNAHGYLPIVCCKPSGDDMGWQSKSFAENVIPIQRVSSSLMNSAIASQRRKVYDRLFYDPTRIRKQDIDKIDPVARIPVKNSQFGKGFEGAVQRLDYSDTGVAEVLQMSQAIVSMGDVVNGQNRVQQGQFQKGNKTRREFDTTMTNANSRQQMSSISLEDSFFMPIKEIIKSNVLQYQPPVTVMAQDGKSAVAVDPTALRKAMIRFTLSDGMISSEKLAALDVASTMVQAATAVPQIAMEYDIPGMLSYMWDLQGLHWINDFKRTPEQLKAQQASVAATTAATGGAKPQSPTAPDAGAQGAL